MCIALDMLWLAYFGHCPEAKLIHSVESTDLISHTQHCSIFISFLLQNKLTYSSSTRILSSDGGEICWHLNGCEEPPVPDPWRTPGMQNKLSPPSKLAPPMRNSTVYNQIQRWHGSHTEKCVKACYVWMEAFLKKKSCQHLYLYASQDSWRFYSLDYCGLQLPVHFFSPQRSLVVVDWIACAKFISA